MNKREMALLEAVGRTGSVTLAAAATKMSQPAASAMLRNLENKLGFSLFTREKRRLALTPEARMLLAEVVNVLAAMDSAERLIASMRGNRTRLVVGAVAAAGASILPGAIAFLKAQDPRINVTVRTDLTLALLGMVADQRIDLGVIVGSCTLPNVGHSVLAELSLNAVMHPANRHAGYSPIRLAELHSEPYIALSRHLQVGALTAREFERANLTFGPSIEVNQYSAACALAERGLGIAILDDMSAIYARRHGLCVRPLAGEGTKGAASETLPLGIVWPLNRGLRPAARQIEAGLRQELAHLAR